MTRAEVLALLEQTKAKENADKLKNITGSKNYHFGRAKLCETLINFIKAEWPEEDKKDYVQLDSYNADGSPIGC